MSAQVHALRELLSQRFPESTPLVHHTAPVVPTAVAPLDRILPGGGLPRGRLTTWARGGGASALLRAACAAGVACGERAVWVDAAGTASSAGWAPGVALVRPSGRGPTLECVETLARSGAYALVVLSGAPTADAERVRLSRAAREGGAALITLDDDGFMGALRITSRFRPERYQWATDLRGERVGVRAVAVGVQARAMGWDRGAELLLPVRSHDLHLSLEPGLVDRRGGAR